MRSIDSDDMGEEAASELMMWVTVVEAIPVSVYVRDRKGRFIGANGRSADFIGFDRAALIGKTLHDLLPKPQADELATGDEEVLDRGEEVVRESPIRRGDGTTAMVLTVKSPLRNKQGDVIGIIAYGRDVSDLWEMRRALAEQAEVNLSYRAALESLPDLVYSRDMGGRYVMRNGPYATYEQFLATLEVRRRQQVERELRRVEATTLEHGGPTVDELLLPTPEQGSRYYSATAAPVSDDRGRIAGVTVALRDVHVTKSVELQLRAEAEHDPLTGLLNRRSTRRALEGIAEGSAGLSVIMFDLDHFKQTNDRHGHGVGDQVLVAVAGEVQRALRSSDVLGRWGGEEFLVATPTTSPEIVSGLAARIHSAVGSIAVTAASDVTVPVPVPVSVSVGWAVGSGGEPVDGVIEKADAALYRAKRAGRDRVSA